MDSNNLSSILSGVMSDPEIMNKLSGVLKDPQAMQSISNVVSGMSSAQKNEDDTSKGKSQTHSLPLVQNDEAKNRARLISALKPYLNEERRDKADKLLGLLTLLELSGSANLFNRQ